MMRYISERYNGFSKEGANDEVCIIPISDRHLPPLDVSPEETGKALKEILKKMKEFASEQNVTTMTGDKKMTNAVKEIKTMKILELWEDKQASHIENQYKSNRDRLYKEDSLYKNLFDLALQMTTEIAKENYSEIETRYKTCDKAATAIVRYLDCSRFFTVYTKDTMNKLDTEHKKYKSAKEKLDSDFHEIITMLSACDTYEQ